MSRPETHAERSPPMKTVAALAGCLLFLSAMVRGATYLPITDQQLVDQTPEIVVGLILGIQEEPCMLKGYPCTGYRVVVSRGTQRQSRP